MCAVVPVAGRPAQVGTRNITKPGSTGACRPMPSDQPPAPSQLLYLQHEVAVGGTGREHGSLISRGTHVGHSLGKGLNRALHMFWDAFHWRLRMRSCGRAH